MANRDTDFTEIQYVQLLSQAKSRFEFRSFSDEPLKAGQIIWRHDVDYSPHRALALAKLEINQGVLSTYFFRIRGCDYSVLDIEVKKIILNIAKFGHQIGLHFEMESDSESPSELLDALNRDKELFELILEMPTRAFSFHNPTLEMLEMIDKTYYSMFNAYSNYFFNKTEYVSDSSGYWRYRSLQEVLLDQSINKLQVLTHPEWWTKEYMSPEDKIKRAHFGRAANSQSRYYELLRKLGRLEHQ